MAATITEISIRGYKSIERLDRLPLRSLNLLVGANGAGKSNFVAFMEFLRAFPNRQIQAATQIAGGADALLHLGPKITREIGAEVRVGEGVYMFGLRPTASNQLILSQEVIIHGDGPGEVSVLSLGLDNHEAHVGDMTAPPDQLMFEPWKSARATGGMLSNCIAYHFDDTSSTALVRRWGGINDDERLRSDASNLAAFLHRIRVTHPDHLKQIRDVVRLAAPFFDDFKLRPIPTNPDMIQLEWTQQGTDYPFRPSQLSDGTLRFICLATALLQPDPPAVMMFDEPELGLHPYALTLLAALFRQAAMGPSQIIVSTQSATLLNEFDAEDVIVVERSNGASTFRRLDPATLSEWLAEYAVGELWQKNVFGGRPKPEAGGRP